MHQGRFLMMKSGLSGPFLLLLLLLLSSTVSGLGSVVVKQYGYIDYPLMWLEAQRFCRSSTQYTDLATIYTQSDSDGMMLQQYNAWIGLYRRRPSSDWQFTNNWWWSDGTNYNFYQWAYNQPYPTATCAFVQYNNPWFFSADGGHFMFFFCARNTHEDQYSYTFIPQSMTWTDAQQYCRDRNLDLATFKDPPDLQSAVIQQDFPVWTGLYKEGGTWKWSTGLSEYTQWAPQEPGSNGDCVSISSLTKKMATQNCSAQFPFICLKDNLVVVTENKTWEEALEYCRNLSSSYQSNIVYDLVSVQPVDYSNVMIKAMEAQTEKVWVGLRFLAGQWVWVNGADMLYTDLPLCPLEGQHCGVLSQNGTGSLDTADCLEERNFICYSTYQ